MKYFLFALVALVVVLVTALVVAVSEAAEALTEVDDLKRDLSAKDTRIKAMERQIETDDWIFTEQKRIIKDPHFRKVVFCSECKSGRYSETIGSYLCGIEEKEEKDYCSSGDPKD